jgi:hypothetical protein
MKTSFVFFILLFGTVFLFGQENSIDKQENSIDKIDDTEPKVQIDVKKEYDEEGNLSRYDSSYSWIWSDKGLLDEEALKKFEEKMKNLQDEMRVFGDDPVSGLHFDDDFFKNFQKFHKDFEFEFNDSAFYEDHIGKLFDDYQFKIHGFNFNGENFELMPLDNEKMKELEKRMEDLLNGEFDERIRKFIEEHRDEIDEIKDQIRETIPKHRKAI